MDVLKNKSDYDLVHSIIAEVAKATNELRCAQADVRKAQSRLEFVLVVANDLIKRKED